jgi:hypothetical protein
MKRSSSPMLSVCCVLLLLVHALSTLLVKPLQWKPPSLPSSRCVANSEWSETLTAYPRFSRAPSVKELREIYTPTPTDVAFVATTARGEPQKFGLMILLKVYQRLGCVLFIRQPSRPTTRFFRCS